MKKLNISYWTVTGIMSAFILLGALVDISRSTDAVAFINHLGYPAYFVPFIGTMKTLGIIAVLIPGFPKIKEWAYAGLVFDTGGALFSGICVGDGLDKWAPALLALVLVALSYVLYTKRKKQNPAI